MRRVIDGERLTGHGDVSGGYPEIVIYDGVGAGEGAAICTIGGFHWADVAVRTRLAISSGVVEYEAERPPSIR